MKITAVQKYLTESYRVSSERTVQSAENTQNTLLQRDVMNDLKSIASLNYISFKARQNQEFEINLSLEELRQRTAKDTLTDYKMLDVDSEQYNKLEEGDKEALKHLVKAARVLNNVYLRQDNEHNIPFRNYLVEEARKGNKKAEMTLELFNAQKGINAKDINAQNINLAKGINPTAGRGFYPEDLSKEEFHNILIQMLENGKKDEVRDILSQRTMVIRDGDGLKAADYTSYFQKEFQKAAHELQLASHTSTKNEFTSYLIFQAEALLQNNPKIDALADRQWAKLQDTPLEFTISRESYDDRLTPTVNENPKLKKMLEEADITAYPKDNIGIRVGIVNKAGTDYILKIKDFIPMMAEEMPFKDEYVQNITKKDNKQTMVDADIVDMQGQIGAYRGAVSLASNLPNNDKLAIKQGGGHRNVYHIQTRNAKYANNVQEKLDALLEPSLHQYFDVNALHDFTILHENIHSLGPKENLEALGIYRNIIEENKADMGALTMLDLLTKKGFYTPVQQKKIITSFMLAYVLKGPNFDDAHRKRNIMQHNYYIKNNAVKVSEDGKMSIDFDRVTELSKEMLKQIVRIQIDRDPQKAKEYIDKNAVWSEELERLSANLRRADKAVNSRIVTPLGDKLAKEI